MALPYQAKKHVAICPVQEPSISPCVCGAMQVRHRVHARGVRVNCVEPGLRQVPPAVPPVGFRLRAAWAETTNVWQLRGYPGGRRRIATEATRKPGKERTSCSAATSYIRGSLASRAQRLRNRPTHTLAEQGPGSAPPSVQPPRSPRLTSPTPTQYDDLIEAGRR